MGIILWLFSVGSLIRYHVVGLHGDLGFSVVVFPVLWFFLYYGLTWWVFIVDIHYSVTGCVQEQLFFISSQIRAKNWVSWFCSFSLFKGSESLGLSRTIRYYEHTGDPTGCFSGMEKCGDSSVCSDQTRRLMWDTNGEMGSQCETVFKKEIEVVGILSEITLQSSAISQS